MGVAMTCTVRLDSMPVSCHFLDELRPELRCDVTCPPDSSAERLRSPSARPGGRRLPPVAAAASEEYPLTSSAAGLSGPLSMPGILRGFSSTLQQQPVILFHPGAQRGAGPAGFCSSNFYFFFRFSGTPFFFSHGPCGHMCVIVYVADSGFRGSMAVYLTFLCPYLYGSLSACVHLRHRREETHAIHTHTHTAYEFTAGLFSNS